jgi:hypothetical protein
MQSPIVDVVAHRARLAWVSTAVVASIVAFVLSRPAQQPSRARHHHHHHLSLIGQCGEHHAHHGF